MNCLRGVLKNSMNYLELCSTRILKKCVAATASGMAVTGVTFAMLDEASRAYLCSWSQFYVTGLFPVINFEQLIGKASSIGWLGQNSPKRKCCNVWGFLV